MTCISQQSIGDIGDSTCDADQSRRSMETEKERANTSNEKLRAQLTQASIDRGRLEGRLQQ
jgi:hypothetical protein